MSIEELVLEKLIESAVMVGIRATERDSAVRVMEETAHTLKSATEQATRERGQMQRALLDASAEISTLRQERDEAHVRHSRCFIAMSNLLAKSENYLNNADRPAGRRATVNAFRLALAEAKEVYRAEIPF
jgi:hypothetical protein